MPKIKTKRGAAKRFKISKTGKVKAKKAKLRHILTCKTRKQKRRLRKAQIIKGADAARVRRLMPYG